MPTMMARMGAAWPRLSVLRAAAATPRDARHPVLQPLAVCAALLAAGVVAAAEPTPAPEPAPMPPHFAVEALKIRLVRSAGNAAFNPLSIELAGHAGGLVSQGSSRWPFVYSDQALASLLDALYAVGFFELRSHLAQRRAVQLGPDGQIDVVRKITSSSSGNRVCVNVAPAFEKCVDYGSEAPADLLRLVQGVFDEAKRLTGKP